MSVFGVKGIWSTQLGNGEEEFDVGSMCWIGTHGLVVTGSLQGFLRIYRPQQREYSAEDLVLEMQLEPILQVSAGEFIRQDPEQSLAVLHNKKLSVYSIQRVDQAISKLVLRYKHDFAYNVFNFTFGLVSGEAQPSLIICVQSSHGALLFFDYESPQFGIQLPRFCVPGPLTFSNLSNSILVCNANMEVESYSCRTLYRAEEDRRAGREANYDPEWRVNIGEYALAITVETGSRTVLVLGEHSLFALKETGAIAMQKRLDYPPSCLVNYLKESSQQMLVCGSFTGHILVYEEQRLVWTAKDEDPPIVMTKIRLRIPGFLLMLSETGRLKVCYLGTSPLPHNIVPSKPAKSIETMEFELIKCHEALSTGASKQETRDALVVSVDVDLLPTKEPRFLEGFATDSALVTTFARVSVSSNVTVTNLNLQVCSAKAIEASENPLNKESLTGREPHVFTIGFMTRTNYPVSSLDGRLTVAYKLNGACRAAEVPFRIPLAQVATSVEAVEQPSTQVDFSIKGSTLPINRIFQDFPYTTSTMVSFQFYNGESATVLLSKTGDKLRIAGTDFGSLGIIVDELNLRLQLSGASLVYEDIPPLSLLFKIIDEHFNCRKAQAEGEAELSKLMQQFIAVQKRILTRFKDRSPAPVNNLDYLLHKTLRYLEEVGERVEQLKQAADIAGESLSSNLRLTMATIRSMYKIEDASFEVLKSHVPLEVTDDDQGWEEQASAGIIELLRTKLAKSDRERQIGIGSLDFPKNTEQLKKNLTILFDRLSKGFRLA